MQEENEKLMEEKAHEIEAPKKEKEDLRVKSATEITKLKKEQDRRVVEKAHLFYSRLKMEAVVVDSY